MGTYLLSKFKWVLITLLGIVAIAFLLLKSVPGDPVYSLVGPRASQETVARYRQTLGLDRPLVVQFVSYLSMVARGDLGVSYFSKRKVSSLIAEKFPNTLRLALLSTFFGIVIGGLLGVLRFLFRSGWFSAVFNFFSLFLISTPVFWFALLLILLFVHYLKIVPGVGMGRGEFIYMLLPALALGSRTAAFLARFIHSELEEEQYAKYVATARAKGLSDVRILLGHIMRNVLVPVITIIGLDLASYLNGSVLTETVFSWDGVGRLAMDSILKRDYPVILGCVIVGAFFFVLVNLIVDIVYVVANPRIRLGSTDGQ